MELEIRSVFEAGQDSYLLNGLSLVNFSTRHILPEKPSNTCTEQIEGMDKERSIQMIPEISDRMCCSTCQCVFESREEQIEHYKLDWHRFNLKQRLMGKVMVSVQEFEDRMHAGDVSSISGSDWEDSSEETETGPVPAQIEDSNFACEEGHRMGSLPHRVLFQNAEGQFLSVFRCVLSTRKDAEMEPSDLVECLKSLHVNCCWLILMTGGGHFAGAVFRGNEVVKHKTFHRYTIRAKRGTSQGLHDSQNHGSMPKSAGASLRRYNELALLKDIQILLESWAQELQEAHAIFLRAPSHNTAIFYGRKNSLLQKNDPRIRNIPIATRRATFKEVKRVHATLAALQVYECPGLSDEKEEEDLVSAEELIMEEESLETLHLKEFEVFPRRKRKKKKRKDGKKSNEGLASAPQVAGDSIHTPCKGGRSTDSEFFDCSAVPGTHLLKFSAGATPINEALKSAGSEEQRGRTHFSVSTGEGALAYQLRNELFTFCKTGATISLQCLLQPLLLGAPESEERPGAPVHAEPVHIAGKMADECVLWTDLLRPDFGNALREQQEPKFCTSSERSDEQEAPVLRALINERVESTGFTLLHVAAAAGQSSIVHILMDAGWDPAVRDDAGQTPYLVSADKRTRNVFRKYQADNPEKFDYSKSQIPEPLTAEIETKKLEKRRAQKTQRRQREKEEKERHKQEEAEVTEKIRFAALSDREKRALAAERRFAEQLSSEGTPVTNIKRCWTCGESLLGRIPFQYLDFSFCSTACLQLHRRSRAAKS